MPDATHSSGDVAAEDRGRIIDFPAGRRSGSPPQNNLPLQLTSFVGREQEVAALRKLLATEARLLTLTGSGGSGKTRLALAVSSEVAERFEDGVLWVELAPVSDPELVPQAVAQALMIREEPGRSLAETLVRDLAPTELLLVLDNCEHLIDACARLADVLLHACPNLRILATSRETLAVEGEMTWPVQPLSAPESRNLGAGELEQYESVRLFVERARYRKPNFALDDRNAASVAEICGRLDGIPLAIELAAARIGTLSAAHISSRLERSLKLLASGDRRAPERQRTLRAALDWSFDLLQADERKLFGRLSVFAGGFTLEAAEAVGAGGRIEGVGVLDLLSRLVDKSLVLAVERSGEVRYRLLEPVSQYAREMLRESGEEPQTLMRHAEYFLALAEEAEPELGGTRQGEWLERLEAEHDNFRAALGRQRPCLGATRMGPDCEFLRPRRGDDRLRARSVPQPRRARAARSRDPAFDKWSGSHRRRGLRGHASWRRSHPECPHPRYGLLLDVHTAANRLRNRGAAPEGGAGVARTRAVLGGDAIDRLRSRGHLRGIG